MVYHKSSLEFGHSFEERATVCSLDMKVTCRVMDDLWHDHRKQGSSLTRSYDLSGFGYDLCDYPVGTREMDDVPNFEAMISAAVANALPCLRSAL
ncbi:hypothetical protein Tco_0635035 [Tanacetum coccineum]